MNNTQIYKRAISQRSPKHQDGSFFLTQKPPQTSGKIDDLTMTTVNSLERQTTTAQKRSPLNSTAAKSGI